jgi:23S rRNA pseudouridine2605 synthase
VTIGRLDINTEGLLLLTNDGGLARVLELPDTGWLRRYRVRAYGDIDQERLDKLKEGIAVDGVLYGPIEATLDRKQGHNVWVTVGLREGKNREIKNVMGALGLDVNRLIRLSYGPFQLADLPEGEVQEVRGRTLRDQLGPRLIEQSGANFDAPIVNPQDAEVAEPAATRGAHDRPSEKSVRRERNFEKPGDKRERDRARLDTRRDAAPGKGAPKDRGAAGHKDAGHARGDAKSGKPVPRKPAPGGRRSANVWMAPGARPVSPKKAAEAEAEAARRAERSERPGRNRKSAGAEETPRRNERSFRAAAGADARPERKSAPRSGFKSAAPSPDRSGRGSAGKGANEGANKGAGRSAGKDPRKDPGKPKGPRGPAKGRNDADRRR